MASIKIDRLLDLSIVCTYMSNMRSFGDNWHQTTTGPFQYLWCNQGQIQDLCLSGALDSPIVIKSLSSEEFKYKECSQYCVQVSHTKTITRRAKVITCSGTIDQFWEFLDGACVLKALPGFATGCTYIPNIWSVHTSLLEIFVNLYQVFAICPLLQPNDLWPLTKTIGVL